MADTKPKPKSDVPPLIVHLLVDALDPAPFNRPARTGFDAKSIKQLAESILAQGIIQPLIVRPSPEAKKGRHEIVCGERRWTAARAKEAGPLKSVPCIVRDDLTDQQARELNALENLQRVDLHPIEEAQSYQSLLAERDAQGQPLYTVETLHQQLGKSVAWIYARLKLLKLPPFAQQAMYNGKLNASVALLLCRIPNPKLAHKASLEVLDQWGQGEGAEREQRALDPDLDNAMSFRKAKDHIQQRYMIRLKGAPFDQEDAALVPVEFQEGPIPANARKDWVQSDPAGVPLKFRCAGGACSDCPCRTGNMKDLFGDVDSADVCTNTACFKRKKDAAARNEQRAAKEKGELLLGAGKSEQIIAQPYGAPASAATLRATDEYIDLKAKPEGKRKTYEELLEDHLPEGTLIHVAKAGGRKFRLLPRDVAAQAAKAAGFTLPKAAPSGDSQATYQEQQRRREKKIERTTLIAGHILQALHAAAVTVKPSLAFFRHFLPDQIAYGSKGWCHLFGCDSEAALKTFVAKKATLEECTAIVAFNQLSGMIDYEGDLEVETFSHVLKFYGLNLDKLKAAAEKQLDDKSKAPAAKSK
jgi:ParB/RepB/Spo0J family partition protein